MDQESANFLYKLQENKTLLDILLAWEDYLDHLNIYAFKNWFDGKVVDGPDVKRHWVTVICEWPIDQMPDPRGAKRLINHGAKVTLRKTWKEVPKKIQSPAIVAGKMVEKTEKEEIVLIEIKIPRRFVDDVLDRNIEKVMQHINKEDYVDAATMDPDQANRPETAAEGEEAEEPDEEAEGSDDIEDTEDTGEEEL